MNLQTRKFCKELNDYIVEPFRRELSEIAAPSRTVNLEGESGHALDQMTYRCALDKDSDVRSFVMSFVDPETLEKQREKEMKAAAEMAEAAIEARAEENYSNYDDDDDEEDDDEEDEEDEDEEEIDDDEVLDEVVENSSNELKTSKEKETSTTSPMQDIEGSRSPVADKETTRISSEPMEITTSNSNDEDEIMPDAEPIIVVPSNTLKSTQKPTTAVVLPRQNDKESE